MFAARAIAGLYYRPL